MQQQRNSQQKPADLSLEKEKTTLQPPANKDNLSMVQMRVANPSSGKAVNAAQAIGPHAFSVAPKSAQVDGFQLPNSAQKIGQGMAQQQRVQRTGPSQWRPSLASQSIAVAQKAALSGAQSIQFKPSSQAAQVTEGGVGSNFKGFVGRQLSLDPSAQLYSTMQGVQSLSKHQAMPVQLSDMEESAEDWSLYNSEVPHAAASLNDCNSLARPAPDAQLQQRTTPLPRQSTSGRRPSFNAQNHESVMLLSEEQFGLVSKPRASHRLATVSRQGFAKEAKMVAQCDQQSAVDCFDAVSQLSYSAQNCGGLTMREASSSQSLCSDSSDALMAIGATNRGASGEKSLTEVEQTAAKRTDPAGQSQIVPQSGVQSRLTSTTPFQLHKVGFQSENLNQRTSFTIPKTRPLQLGPSSQTEGAGGQPVGAQEIQVSGQENNSQEQSKLENTSNSKQSYLLDAKDGLAPIPFDKSMDVDELGTQSPHRLTENHPKQEKAKRFTPLSSLKPRIDSAGDSQGLKVVCERPDSAQQILAAPKIESPIEPFSTHQVREPKKELLRQQRFHEQQVVQRMRLHSNFTSIGRSWTQAREAELEATEAAAMPAQAFQSNNKIVVQPRHKRVAQSIVNGTRCGEINLPQRGSQLNWGDTVSISGGLSQQPVAATEPAASTCQSCLERKLAQEFSVRNHHPLIQQFQQQLVENHEAARTEKHVRLRGAQPRKTVSLRPHFALIQAEAVSVQEPLGKTRFSHVSRHPHPQSRRQEAADFADDSLLKTGRSLSVRMLSGTSSYSSNRFGSKEDLSREQGTSGAPLLPVDEASSQTSNALIPQSKVIPSRTSCQVEFEQRSQQTIGWPSANAAGSVSNRIKQHHHREYQHHAAHSTRLQDKQNVVNAAASNASYISSTRFQAGPRQHPVQRSTRPRHQVTGQHFRYAGRERSRSRFTMPERASSGGSRSLSNTSNVQPRQSHHAQMNESPSKSRSRKIPSRRKSKPASSESAESRSKRVLPMRTMRMQEKESDYGQDMHQAGSQATSHFEQYRHKFSRQNTEQIKTSQTRQSKHSRHNDSKRDREKQSSLSSRNRNRHSERDFPTLDDYRNSRRRHSRKHDERYACQSNHTQYYTQQPRDSKYERRDDKVSRYHGRHSNQRLEGSTHHRYHPHDYSRLSRKGHHREESRFADTKDAFYAKRHHKGQRQQHHSRHQQLQSCSRHVYDKHSRGKGSFKTYNERLYRKARRSRSRLSSFSSRGGRSLISSFSRGPPISGSLRHSKRFPSQRSSDSRSPADNDQAPVDRSRDAGHFEWHKGMVLASNDPAAPSSKYKIVSHMGDGTFGRALECIEMPQSEPGGAESLPLAAQEKEPKHYAVKVIRAVPRYAESAKFEASILQDLQRQGGCERGIVYLKEMFTNRSRQSYGHASNSCLVFEPLGKSLYDFIKDNGYKGFEIGQIREIALQALQAIEFLHSVKLTHTDLKVENILFVDDKKETITDEKDFPVQVRNKRSIYGSQKCSDYDDSSYFSGQSQQLRGRKWFKPVNCSIKVIDFGGATYAHERHTLIINTRQYRAPEVILENSWNEKSDMWSMACILVELYTGELFFDTDENLEHLAMIEKQCGPLSLRMAQQSANEQIKRQLHCAGSSEEEQYVRTKQMRLRWPAASLRATSRQAVQNMLLLDDIIQDKWGEQHSAFKDLLKFMLKMDPAQRPSATECLQHAFFAEVRHPSKSTEKTQVSSADHQFESPRLKLQ